MTVNYKGKIAYKMHPTHPDYNHVVGGYKPRDVLTYEDKYWFNPEFFNGEEGMILYIKNDLMRVAGGGYNSRHIYDVEFTIERM